MMNQQTGRPRVRHTFVFVILLALALGACADRHLDGGQGSSTPASIYHVPDPYHYRMPFQAG